MNLMVHKDTVLPDPPSAMSMINLATPPQRIALFKAIIESYDNLATLRTEDPRRHHLKLYFAPEMTEEIEALLYSLQAAFAIRRTLVTEPEPKT
jgi:hypothetical protein